MSGKGKYTTYNSSPSKKVALEKLFSGGTISSPFYGLDETESIKEAVNRGNEILRAAATGGYVKTPDLSINIVDLTYQARKGSDITPPTAITVEENINSAGDPMNAYVPDISSPGPDPAMGPNPDGMSTLASDTVHVRVEGVDKINNPKISPQDMKAGWQSSDTKLPGDIGATIHNANVLG